MKSITERCRLFRGTTIITEMPPFIIRESYEKVWRANLSVTSQRSLATKVGVKYCSNKSFVTKAMMAASNSTNKMTSPLRKVKQQLIKLKRSVPGIKCLGFLYITVCPHDIERSIVCQAWNQMHPRQSFSCVSCLGWHNFFLPNTKKGVG